MQYRVAEQSTSDYYEMLEAPLNAGEVVLLDVREERQSADHGSGSGPGGFLRAR